MTQKEEITYSNEDSQDDFSPPACGAADKKSKIKKLKKKLKECQKEKEKYLTGWQRAQADLINYRRRQEEIMEEFRKYSQESLIREILPVLDSLRIGQEQIPELKPIKKQLKIILEKHNLKGIKAKGEKFNPEFHEAVEMVESNKESGGNTEEKKKKQKKKKKKIKEKRKKKKKKKKKKKYYLFPTPSVLFFLAGFFFFFFLLRYFPRFL